MAHEDPLLDKVSLKRHFNFVNPEVYQLIKFQISNKWNEFMNKNNKTKEDIEETQELENLTQDEEAEHEERRPMDVVEEGIILGVIPKSDQLNEIIKAAGCGLRLMASKPDKNYLEQLRDQELCMYREGEKLAYMVKDNKGNIHESYVEDPAEISSLESLLKTHQTKLLYANDTNLDTDSKNAILRLFDLTAKRGHTRKTNNEIHIFSVTDEFEQGMPGMLTPQELETKHNGITFKHHQVPMTDFGAEITSQAILATVYKMREIIEKGGTVYIHCKAGRARSAMIVATYIAIFGDSKNLESAVNQLKQKRPQVDLHDDKVVDWNELKLMEQKGNVNKLKKAQEAINLHRAISLEHKIAEKIEKDLKISDYITKFNECSKKNWTNLSWVQAPVKKESNIRRLINRLTPEETPWDFEAGHTPLSSLEFQNELIQFTSFKQLKIYATQSQNLSKKTSQRTRYVQEFLKEIYEAKDDLWYENWKKGPLYKLYNNSKTTEEVRKLINLFISDIKKYQENKTHKMLGFPFRVFHEVPGHPVTMTQQKADSVKPTKKLVPENEDVRQGRMYVKLMLDAAKVSGLPLDQIQFNFCVSGLPSDKDTIQKSIEKYVDQQLVHEEEISPEDKAKLKQLIHPFSISLPTDASRLHHYQETLELRGKSFSEAAKMIIEHSKLNADITNNVINKLSVLFENFQSDIKDKDKDQNKNELQSYYDAFLDVLKDILKDALEPTIREKFSEEFSKEGKSLSEKEIYKIISNYLKNAETIQNMQQKKSHITLSGTLDGDDAEAFNGNIRMQIDEPLTQFKHLSEKQQEAWIKAIKAYQNKNDNKIPPWFKRLPEFEKDLWAERLTGFNKMETDMVPVVKKEGLPGLRNLALSSFATIKYDGNGHVKTFISNKSVRSSNLVVQNKEGKAKLSDDEKDLTKMNVRQVEHIYEFKFNEVGKRFTSLWGDKQYRKKYQLCQTLLRMKGGGDDNVLNHKNKAIDEENKAIDEVGSNQSLTVYGSNHCIGLPRSPKRIVEIGMHHILGANIKTTAHVANPVKSFIKEVVKPTLKPTLKNKQSGIPSDVVDKIIDPLFKLAEQGQLTVEKLNTTFDSSYNFKNYPTQAEHKTAEERTQQMDSIKGVLLALNMYTQITNNASVYKKEYQLHMAALEEIIYQDTGNFVQSSCKSGKDREGVKICYRNAMLAFFEEHKYFPPPKEDGTEDRQKLIAIFLELFKTHHQARLAELNASGCEGQKALLNILPKDILVELRKGEGLDLLKTHAENSTLNDLGKSKVTMDPAKFESAKEAYSEVIKKGPDNSSQHAFTNHL